MNDLLNIKLSKGIKIAVVGDIHCCLSLFNKLLEKINPSENMIFVSVGDIYDRGTVETAEIIIDKIKNLNEKGYGYIVKGNHELKHIRNAIAANNMSEQLKWISKQPLALSFVFDNGTRATIVHGGITPHHKFQDLKTDVEVAYIRDLDENGQMIRLKRIKNEKGEVHFIPSKLGGKPWHNFYDGRFGFCFSGHNPQKNGIAKFYNYSSNLDSAAYLTGILSCQIFSSKGREELITIY